MEAETKADDMVIFLNSDGSISIKATRSNTFDKLWNDFCLTRIEEIEKRQMPKTYIERISNFFRKLFKRN
jgi:hypothetical protein